MTEPLLLLAGFTVGVLLVLYVGERWVGGP